MQPPEAMKQLNKKITKFPLYVAKNFIYEPVELPENNQIANLIKNLYYADQHFDFLRALKYAEQYFLTKNALEITVDQLEEFFYISHAIIAKSVTFFSTEGAMSGLTIERRMPIIKETGVQGLKYEYNSKEFFSEHNYNIFVKLYGKGDAELYKEFCELLQKAYEKECIRIAPNKPNKDEYFQILNINKYDLIMNDAVLKAHKGCKLYFTILAYSAKPEDISKIVKSFCQNIISKIQSLEKPAHIAATIIAVTRSHAFWNGNGRHVRFIANCILMLLGRRPINLDKYKQKFYLAIENPSQDISLIEKHIEECIEDAENENLGEYTLDEKGGYHAYWPQGTDYAVVEYDDHLDLVLKDNYIHYENISSRIPSSNLINNATNEKAIQKFVNYRIDEQTLVLWAIQCKKMSPILNMYCMRRACDFYLKKEDLNKVLACYIDILNFAKAAGYYEAAYNYTLLALKVSKDPEQKSELTSCLESLSCVANRRNALGLKIDPMAMEEKIRKVLSKSEQSEKVIPNISAVLNPQQPDALKHQLKRITQKDWRVSIEQRRAIYITKEGGVVDQIYEFFKRHNIKVKKGRPKDSSDSMVEINAMEVELFRNIPPIQYKISSSLTARPSSP